MSDLLRYQFLIVVEELMTNIVTHGSPPAGSDVAFDFRNDGHAVGIQLNDSGVPFDPRQMPGADEAAASSGNEGGWGWPLILSWCEKLSYERVGDRNVLSLFLRCQEQS